MKIYVSTFITGTQEIVKEFLVKRKVKIRLLLDGLVVYESDYPEREIRNFRIFNNTYLPFRSFNNLPSRSESIERILSVVAHDKSLPRQIAANLPPHRRNFKIVCSFENQMVSVSRKLLKNLELVILRVRGLRLSIKKPDLEFWTLARREGYGFFGIRITYPFSDKRMREKGEIRREIAYIMCLVSKPNPRDIVMDPFAGHGAIPIERALNFPYQEIIAVEKDKNLVLKLQRDVQKYKKYIKVIHGDALSLREVENESVDKIISDPPWGEYKVMPEPEKFYQNMLREFEHILRPNGIIVLLIGAKDIFENVLQNQFSNIFVLEKKYNILVSGKKASIYRIIKSHEK